MRLPHRPSRPPTPPEPLFDEALLAQLRRLVLLSQRTLAEGLAGEHRSRRRGASPEFTDFKSYSPGDDFRRIDWKTYGRFDELFVRLSEVTTEFDVHILLDASDSMVWRGDPTLPTKFSYARRVAGAIAYVSLWHFDRTAVAPFGTELAPRFGPVQGRAQTVPLLRFLEGLQPLGQTDLPATLDAYLRARKRPGILLLVSDLLSGEPDQLGAALREFHGRGWQTTVVHILDPAELDPTRLIDGSQPEPWELVDAESAERLRLTPSGPVVTRYHEALTAWMTDIEAICDQERVSYLRLETGWPVDTVVVRLLHARGIVA